MPTFHYEKFMMILKFWNHIRGSSKHESPVYLIDDLNLTRLESLNICCNYRSLSMKIVKKKLRTLQELNEDILIVASTVWLSNYLVAGSEPFQHPRWMMKHKQQIYFRFLALAPLIHSVMITLFSVAWMHPLYVHRVSYFN